MGGRVRFDQTKPIDDPTVWYPHPDLWVKFDPSSKGRSGDGDDDNPNDYAFALGFCRLCETESISNKIFNYAMDAGGSIDSSYYRQLLIWVGDYNKEVADIQRQIEAADQFCHREDRKKIRETAYYVWIPFAGTIAGITVDVLAENDIKRLTGILERVQALILD
ncbi:hypothetical protein F4813DRAFT_399227 [Daldinia decipiens]|uniref:uncharacterized protein n=1 Tax=Daldinia decipiens TaxID=326647 RepID=UPI0020C5135F|nr:uncharacterized protein F4813DRAFT_399227 [Daldinia decipiens]KAI1661146.1 hypothetical protein F4813DRAFT_399227 [Daldinia decipiens]